jgi:putative transposase
MSKLQAVEAVSAEGAVVAMDLPERIELPLGEIVADAREGLLALSVRIGLAVLQETMEWEVDRVVGPKGRHDRDRVAKRHGHTRGEVTLGGRRVPVRRPRVRSVDDRHEVGLDSYREFTSRDPLSAVIAERMLAGVSTRQYRRTQEPVGKEVEDECRSTSKSAVSREFIRRARTALSELLARRLDQLELVALMIDGIELDERCHVVALGVTIDGTKVPLGLWEGSTENTTTVTALLADLQERGLGFDQPILCVIDGAKRGQRLLLSSCAPEAGSQGLALLKRLAEQSADGSDLPIDVAVSWLTQVAFGERSSQDVAGSGRRATSAASSAGRPKSRSTPSAW